ncbi:cell division protein FtsQ/DivIB [Veillonella intestinalis]|uniref:cell division protein FtsQ/DivIB n=1 Tax=Veillonella intestinalis TaxID=2941341 RepID=UPI00203D338D|nr:FtsQ-type POTRA domain-containing protein [Veillonella intestinalis]
MNGETRQYSSSSNQHMHKGPNETNWSHWAEQNSDDVVKPNPQSRFIPPQSSEFGQLHDFHQPNEFGTYQDDMGGSGNSEEPPGPPKRPHAWRRRVVWGGGALLIIWALLFMLPIPFGTIQVVGSDKVTVSDVMAAGNIRYPVNLLQINSGQLEERLQHDLRVETAKVTYVLPLTLQVNITERQAAAVVATQFGFATLDSSGRVINLGPAIEDTSAPIISGIKLGNVLLGDMIDVAVIKGTLTYLGSISAEGRKQIAEINVGDTQQLIAYTVDGLPLHLGDTSELDKKGPLSENMLRDVKARGVAAQYLDVNVKAPFIKTP